MPDSPNLPPADERSPDYYQNLFEKRIGKISRSGERAEKHPSRGGAKAGGGILLGVVILALCVGSRASRLINGSKYPPPGRVSFRSEPIPLEPEQHLLGEPDGEPEAPREGSAEREFVLPRPDPVEFLLHRDDVPLPRDLCYHIDRQSRQAKASPGKRIWLFLDAEGRKLIHEAATPQQLAKAVIGDGRPPASTLRILDALNRVLQQPELYERASFRDVILPPGVHGLAEQNLEGLAPRTPGDVIPLNRWLLEAAFHEQILPQHLRHDRRRRIQWRNRAMDDLLKVLRDENPSDHG